MNIISRYKQHESTHTLIDISTLRKKWIDTIKLIIYNM